MRYQRQIILPELGVTGQHKLSKAKVLVIGAGGLGCPALQYLASAGVGTIGIVDFDTVELSNLQRQVVYSENDIGKAKAETAAGKILSLNPEISAIVHHLFLDNSNALDIIVNYDLVIDGSDNFSTRYMLNDACMILNKPLIYGAVLRFEGQLGVFNFRGQKNGTITSYRDFFPVPPDPSTVASCNEAGVLGVLPGIIGTLQAGEAIKIITGIGAVAANKIITYNALHTSFSEFELSPADEATGSYPKNRFEFENFDYALFCGQKNNTGELEYAELEGMANSENTLIIDVREPDELPKLNAFRHINIPLSELSSKLRAFTTETIFIFVCQTGKRSIKALKVLNEVLPGAKGFSLKNGLHKLNLNKSN